MARSVGGPALHAVLRVSGALRRIPKGVRKEVEKIYADPNSNRAFAFLDAVVGPANAVAIHDELKRISVGIVGCGGIGSAVAYLLSGMGVKQFILVDPDVVEEGNLPRQVLYTLADIGRPKALVLAEALRARFKDLTLEPRVSDGLEAKTLSMLARTQLIVCGGDDPPTLSDMLKDSLGAAVPVWACGYALGRSIVRPPSAAKAKRLADSVDWSPIAGGFAPSIGFQNFEIAAKCCAGIVLEGLNGKSSRPYLLEY